jgi:hypothetical protein
MNTRTETPNKPLRQFEAGDLLYVQKMEGGHSFIYLCKFIELDKGVVVAEIVKPETSFDERTGIIRTRAFACYAWTMSEGDKWNNCHWFRNGLDKAGG